MRTKLPVLLVAGFLPLVSGCYGGLGIGSLGPIELGLIGLIVVLVPLIALVDIFMSTRPASEKAIFIVLIFAVPVIGLLAYILLRGRQ